MKIKNKKKINDSQKISWVMGYSLFVFMVISLSYNTYTISQSLFEHMAVAHYIESASLDSFYLEENSEVLQNPFIDDQFQVVKKSAGSRRKRIKYNPIKKNFLLMPY